MPDYKELVDSEKPRRVKPVHLVPVLIFFWFILAFRKEVGEVFNTVWVVISIILGFEVPAGREPLAHSWDVVTFSIFIAFGFVFIAGLWLISSQAIVPVRSFRDIYNVTWHLFLYIVGMHGPAVFVRDGNIEQSSADFRKEAPGIIVVDFNSAIVLEEMVPPPGIFTRLKKMSLLMLEPLRLIDPPQSPRTFGTGIIFTRPWERIRGAVDLRRQIRAVEKQPSKDSGTDRVFAYTRDGIEVHTNLWVIFTVGEAPEQLEVTYIGDQKPENLRVVRFDKPKSGRLRVAELEDSLDEVDRNQIHHYARFLSHNHLLQNYSPLPAPANIPVFFPGRVFSAVFAQARTQNDDVLQWTDLPRRIAIDFFREEISKCNYDDLYKIGEPGPLPIAELRQKVRNRMRNNGVLEFRLVLPCSGSSFEKKQSYSIGSLQVSDVTALNGSKVLRERGIKVIASGFSDLVPASELIYKTRLDSWRSTWERDTEITKAASELEAIRVRSHSRAKSQKELLYAFSQIFARNSHSEEVMAIRIFQALESLAADPATQRLLPAETINLLRSVHDWLLPAQAFENRAKKLGPP